MLIVIMPDVFLHLLDVNKKISDVFYHLERTGAKLISIARLSNDIQKYLDRLDNESKEISRISWNSYMKHITLISETDYVSYMEKLKSISLGQILIDFVALYLAKNADFIWTEQKLENIIFWDVLEKKKTMRLIKFITSDKLLNKINFNLSNIKFESYRVYVEGSENLTIKWIEEEIDKDRTLIIPLFFKYLILENKAKIDVFDIKNPSDTGFYTLQDEFMDRYTSEKSANLSKLIEAKESSGEVVSEDYKTLINDSGSYIEKINNIIKKTITETNKLVLLMQDENEGQLYIAEYSYGKIKEIKAENFSVVTLFLEGDGKAFMGNWKEVTDSNSKMALPLMKPIESSGGSAGSSEAPKKTEGDNELSNIEKMTTLVTDRRIDSVSIDVSNLKLPEISDDFAEPQGVKTLDSYTKYFQNFYGDMDHSDLKPLAGETIYKELYHIFRCGKILIVNNLAFDISGLFDAIYTKFLTPIDKNSDYFKKLSS